MDKKQCLWSHLDLPFIKFLSGRGGRSTIIDIDGSNEDDGGSDGEGGVDGNGDDGGVMTTTGAAVAGGTNSVRAVTAGSVETATIWVEETSAARAAVAAVTVVVGDGGRDDRREAIFMIASSKRSNRVRLLQAIKSGVDLLHLVALMKQITLRKLLEMNDTIFQSK